MNSPPVTPAPATKISSKMTPYEEPTDWASQVESPLPTSPIQSPRPQSPEWETPKAHQMAQKQQISRASKVAKEAKAAATKAAEDCNAAAKEVAKKAEPKPIMQAKAKKPAGPKPGNRNWIPSDELCRSCDIYAPHRVGIYQYMSPELPYKIFNIQRKISKGTATAEDIQLHNGFAAVHTNSPPTQAQHYAGSACPVDGNPCLQGSGPIGHQRSSNADRPRRFRRCRHPECRVTASHPRGRYRLSSCSTPRKIQIIMTHIAEGLVTEEEYCILVAYRAVHSPARSDQGGDEVDQVDDCASVSSGSSVAIIC